MHNAIDRDGRIRAEATRLIADFGRSERGGILVFFGVSLAVLLGLIALSYDFGRMASTQSELQSFSDNVALAAAGELDGRADSITRANNAAANLISDIQTFGNGAQQLQGATDYTLTYFSALPPSDLTAPAATTADPLEARYVRVTATPETVRLTFAAALAALTGTPAANNTVGAVAIAGYTQFACDITPLMFCLPDPNYTADANIGDLIRLRAGGNGAAWGPGDFGFLDPSNFHVDTQGVCSGLNGAQLQRCLLGAEGPITQCFRQDGVETEPGQKVGITDAAFNVRFDIFKGAMGGKKNDPNYAPAPNVIKGIVPNGGGSCIGNNEQPSPDTVGLPRDDCFGAGTCTRFGDGNWAAGRVNYVNVNYGGADPHAGASTRYGYYKAEIAAAGGGGSGNPILQGGLSETGRPMCSSNQSIDPDRRVVIAAAVDCVANPINGHEVGVPVEEFFRLFMTEPVGDDGLSPPTLDLWVEVVGSAGGGGAGTGGTSGVFHDVVQLYR